jgi:aspartyl/asparaginyl beta-hydroxylase (cupin superfamily)
VCHLPLVIPPDCALRVGNETRAWREGELLMFDDTIEHEAWNKSSQLRVVLIFDVWRPELSREEQALIATMLAAIDRFGGARVEWQD